METEFGDVGIPPLIDPEGRWWERTWDVTFATAVDAAAISQSATELTDPWIEVVARSTGTAEAAITLRSEKTVDYVDFWNNGFRVLMLLSRRLAFIEKIEGREGCCRQRTSELKFDTVYRRTEVKNDNAGCRRH